MELLRAIGHFVWDNGVGQNLTASAILAIPATIWARRKLIPAWRKHHRRVQELHEQLTTTPSGGPWSADE